MDIQGWITIAIGIITVITSIGWAATSKSIRNIISNARELSADYCKAMEDKNLSDDEVKAMLPHVITVIEESASVWQTLSNAFYKILPFFKKK